MTAASAAPIRSFNRYELKYVIHASQLEAMLADIRSQMAPDSYGDENGAYIISNLYYDSPQLHMLRSKTAGNNYRRKLRVRVYGENRDGPPRSAMAEIKQRLGRTTQKRRVVLPLDEALRLCEGHSDWGWSDDTDRAVAEEIRGLVLAMQLRPACTISYRRHAFVGGRYEPGLRVTFDTCLWSAPPRLDFYAVRPTTLLLPRDWSVLEIKIDDKAPYWVTEFVTRHGCQLRSVSKYCLGMTKLHERGLQMAMWPSSSDARPGRLVPVPAVRPASGPIPVSGPLPVIHPPARTPSRTHTPDTSDEQLSAATRTP